MTALRFVASWAFYVAACALAICAAPFAFFALGLAFFVALVGMVGRVFLAGAKDLRNLADSINRRG